jgi:nuclear pore complex protein Nup62
MYNEIQSIESTQRDVDQSLEYIDSQQKSLSNILESYEAQIHNLNQRQGGIATGADAEREKA